MAKARKRMLVVDGYNVLRSGSRYRSITSPDYTDDSFNTARERLVNDVIDFAGRTYEAYIVYDGGGNAYSQGEPETVGRVKIIFSPAGSSADKVIEKLAHEGRARGMEVLVVTSDATIQDTVFGGGVDRMSANGFSREMEMLKEDTRLDDAPVVSRKMTLGERIDADTLAKLKALRDAR
jgi:predicted RNA-binding protein with PIN domain